jgi:hypothetical protein
VFCVAAFVFVIIGWLIFSRVALITQHSTITLGRPETCYAHSPGRVGGQVSLQAAMSNREAAARYVVPVQGSSSSSFISGWTRSILTVLVSSPRSPRLRQRSPPPASPAPRTDPIPTCELSTWNAAATQSATS